jgi:hypothetical protein
MGTPAAERKAAERQRKREEGLIPLEVWTYPAIVLSLKTYIETINRKHRAKLSAKTIEK